MILLHRGPRIFRPLGRTRPRAGRRPARRFSPGTRAATGSRPGERGDAENFSVYVRDLEAFARHLSEAHELPLENFAVVAHSVGAVVAAAWVHDFAPPIRALVLATPAFRVKLYVPLAIPGLRLLQKVKPHAGIRSYVGGRLLTHDRAEARRYDADPAHLAPDQRARAARSCTTPPPGCSPMPAPSARRRSCSPPGRTPWCAAGRSRQFFERLSSPIKQWEILAGFSHAIFHERGRQAVFRKVRDFLDDAFAHAPESPRELLAADQRGHTRREHDALRRPLGLVLRGKISFAAQRAGLGSLCRLSDGVRIGWRTGFDSGQSLDYIYENHPRGVTPLGRLIDRQYLNAIGWRGIRQRKVHLAQDGRPRHRTRPRRRPAAAAARHRRRAGALPAGICGNTPTCRSPRGCATAARAVWQRAARWHGKWGWPTASIYEQGDAFDEAALAALTPRPTVAVVSGLYELFPANRPC